MTQLRQIASEGIVNEFRSKNTHPLLIEILTELYGVKPDGSTNTLTIETMPQPWRDAAEEAEQRGKHIYVEPCLQGLAAETVEMLGDTKVLWNGMFTKAMVRMLQVGGIEPDAIRKHIKAIRTIIYCLKTELWKHRNECNFDEHVERERLEEQQMREEIQTHIRTNDEAQKSAHNVQTVMNMTPEDRSKWFKDTRDRGTVQRTLDRFLVRPADLRTQASRNRTRRLPAVRNQAAVLEDLEQQLPSNGLKQQSISQHFQPQALERNNVGTLTKQEYAALETQQLQQRSLDQKEYQRCKNVHKRLKRQNQRRAAASSRKRTARKADLSRENTVQPLCAGTHLRRPKSAEWGPNENENHWDFCNVCDYGGSLVLCYSCNHVYHRKCHASLPNRGKLPDFWQCDTCVQEEHTRYGTPMAQLRPPMANNNAEDADAEEKYDEYNQDVANDSEIEDANDDGEFIVLSDGELESRTPARLAGGRRISTSRSRNKKHKSITTMIDDPADDDTDDSDTEQPPRKIQIMDFFKKNGHKPGPAQLGQPNVKEKAKIIDMSKDQMDV